MRAIAWAGARPCPIEISETLASGIVCSSSEIGALPARKSTMKAIHVQLPARLTKRILFPGASPPRAAGHPRLLIESGRRGYWYAFFRSLRAVLSGVLDSSAYDHISLRREVSVAFTSQGPVVYRCGRNSRVHPIPATRETNRSCQLARK